MEKAIVVLKSENLINYVKEIKKFFNVIDIVLINKKTKKIGDIYISLGGDGTFLWTVNIAKTKPVIGFNFGSVGFLANYNFEDAGKIFLKIKNGKILPERRSRIRISNLNALNDIIVSYQKGNLVKFNLKIDNHKDLIFRGNGIVFSTSTGSTATNLYTCGPIVLPTLDCIIITPIIPYSFYIKPIVVSIDSKISLKVSFDKVKPMMMVDGRVVKFLKNNEILKIEKGDDAYIYSYKDIFDNYKKITRLF